MASGNSNAPGLRLLPRAAEAGNAQLVARLLGEGRDVNEADETGDTALVLASLKGHDKAVRLLLARQGVEVNKTEKHGCTALYLASLRGHVEVVRLLLAQQDVDVNKTAPNGDTALMVASEEGHLRYRGMLSA
jgi:ankyrin repeat protein